MLIAHLVRLPTNELRIHLHEVLLVEKAYQLLCDVINASNFDEAMIRLEQALPCLLHLENRVSETIIEHLIRVGMQLCDGNPTSTRNLIEGVERIINENIFGSVGCSSNWKLPLNTDGTVGKVKLANWRARRVIENMNDIIALCLPGDSNTEQRNKWGSVVDVYIRTIKVSLKNL
jgi:hypothetical protein